MASDASPQFRKLVARLRARGRVPLGDLAMMRAGMEAVALPVADDVTVAPTSVAGMPAEWLAAPSADDRVILYVHGGGFCLGSLRTHRKLAGDVARAAGARVLLVDYPLAPERPFPAAIHALVGAYEELRRTTPAARIALAGDSAGGGLAVAALVALRERGAALPAAAACISPWVDLVRTDPVPAACITADPIVAPEDLVVMGDWYLAGADPAAALASPVRADLRGLPPLLVHVGAAEVLVADAEALAERARAAGVAVTLEVWPEMIHVWHIFAGRVPEATAAVERVGAFLRQRFAAR